MRKKFLPVDLSERLFRLGFSEPCIAFFDHKRNIQFLEPFQQKKPFIVTNKTLSTINCLSAPLWEEASEWLIQKTGKYLVPILADDNTWLVLGKKYKTFYGARLACTKKWIEIAEKESLKKS